MEEIGIHSGLDSITAYCTPKHLFSPCGNLAQDQRILENPKALKFKFKFKETGCRETLNNVGNQSINK